MALKPLKSPLLAALPGVRHGFFGRRGGVSTGVFASLNVGLRGGDRPERVWENRRRIAAALGVPLKRLHLVRQVHGTEVALVEAGGPRPGEADALVAQAPGDAVAVTTADCAPVLIADPEGARVAAVHAGWRGLVAGVIERTLETLERLGSPPERLYAAIGPCIAQANYAVDTAFEAAFLSRDPRFAPCFARGDGQLRFDLAEAAARVLLWCGLSPSRIDRLLVDTFACEEAFFSYRRSRARGEERFGVQLSAILFADLEQEPAPSGALEEPGEDEARRCEPERVQEKRRSEH